MIRYKRRPRAGTVWTAGVRELGNGGSFIVEKKNWKILFQGDSVTDCGREREDSAHLGYGYPKMAAELLAERHPDQNFTFWNRGISGNRTKDLLARWEEDCLALQPNLVSILIGINDTWRRFDANDPTSAAMYEDNYRRLLRAVREKTSARILVIEPFVLPDTPVKDFWREDLDPKIQACRRVARELADAYLPMDGLFAAACMEQPAAHWAADGVHPTEAGAAFLAKAYVREAETLLGL